MVTAWSAFASNIACALAEPDDRAPEPVVAIEARIRQRVEDVEAGHPRRDGER